MKVIDLINLLSALTEEQKQLEIECAYDCDCASTEIVRIRDIEAERVVLSGDH